MLIISGFSAEPGVLPRDGKTAFLAKPFDAAALINALSGLVAPARH